MAFKFKMQKVLDYREQLEEEAKVRLADAENKLQRCRDQLTRLVEEIRNAEAKATEVMTSADRWLHDQYLKGLHGDYTQLEMQERLLAQVAAEAQAHLSACAIERKMLDKLKERQRIQYQRLEQKQELNFNDEIATIRHKATSI